MEVFPCSNYSWFKSHILILYIIFIEGIKNEAFYFKVLEQCVIIQSHSNGYLKLNKDGVLSCGAGVHDATNFEVIQYNTIWVNSL